MPRFTSLDYAPAETRRLLRELLLRRPGREAQRYAPGQGGPALADESMLRLHQSLDMTSIVSLVPMMEFVKLDGCEDDLTAVIRELLSSRLDFLRWSAPDQSKGGTTPKGNPGERDLMIVRGTTVLAIIEAVICRNPIHLADHSG